MIRVLTVERNDQDSNEGHLFLDVVTELRIEGTDPKREPHSPQSKTNKNETSTEIGLISLP